MSVVLDGGSWACDGCGERRRFKAQAPAVTVDYGSYSVRSDWQLSNDNTPGDARCDGTIHFCSRPLCLAMRDELDGRLVMSSLRADPLAGLHDVDEDYDLG